MVERGAHAELLERGGRWGARHQLEFRHLSISDPPCLRYAEMWNLQNGEEVEGGGEVEDKEEGGEKEEEEKKEK